MAKNLFVLANSLSSSNFEIQHQTNPLCEGICNLLVELLKSNKKSNQSSETTTILIVDRMFDPISPLVRSFSYGPMLRDLKRVEQNFIITGEGINKSIFYFDDSDSVLSKYKDKHFS